MKAEAADRRRVGVRANAGPGIAHARSGLLPLPAEFFNRDPREVGPDLLGKLLVRRYRKELLIGRVVETEAYLGALDPAAHAYAGKTARNAVLFGPPGVAYVYLIYGNHFCLNVSCMPEGDGEGVLFRALEPVRGLATMAKLRGLEIPPQVTKSLAERPATAGRLRLLCGGPGRLTEAMQITRQRHNGMPLTSADSELFLADDGFHPKRITTTVRVGLTKAAEMPLRYVIAGNPFVSGKREL